MNPPITVMAGPEGGPVAAAILVGSPVLTVIVGRIPWWGTALVIGVVLLCLGWQIRGRTPVRWTLDAARFHAGRTARARQRLQAPRWTDVTVPAGSCAIGVTDSALLAMIQVAPNLDLPTVIGEDSIYTEDTLDTDLLARLCEQYGLSIDIDIVTTGRRVRQIGSYGDLYGQLIGPRPVVGQRLTWLVLRLDLHTNLRQLQRRGPTARTAPTALATAAQRIAARLREAGIAAHPLPTDAVVEATQLLHEGIVLDSLKERWGRLDCRATGRAVTVYELDSTTAAPTDLDHYWTHETGSTTVVVSLRKRLAPRVLVRYIAPTDTDLPAESALRLLTGHQSTALLATLPTPTVVHALPTRTLDHDHDPTEPPLQVTIGPNGQVLGAITGHRNHTLALPLFDPVHYHPRRRTVDVHAELPIAQQIVLRAAVVGADVEIHTDRPASWERLVKALGDHRSLRLATSGDPDHATTPTTPATIAVFDQVSPQASPAPTTLTITAPDQPSPRDVDLAIEQIGDSTVEVSIPMRTVRVDLIEPRGETRYVQSLHPSQPDSTEPATSSDAAAIPYQTPDPAVNSGDSR
ncbi:type VII secretion protein EccE [Nocardia sp. 2]|uniref:Type VII secretion protein EccE n=1 Tax=Nocardia acididurans TaxID=2802282 RepID=A0ABS1MGI3_9NOCA|nr:type VII secretion protein EccE [Nocardia acididurans]MBL1079783.1 type VII secretion protein EccE [Nocardia acididurans]